MENYNRSTSSVWGSALYHMNEKCDMRLEYDKLSVPESRVSLDIDTTERLTGSRNIVCKTEAEYKANKLNRSEQAKLENLKCRVVKEKTLQQRQFTQIEKAFRAKSARLINRIQNIESHGESRQTLGESRQTLGGSRQRPSSYRNTSTPRSKLLPKRPNSFPSGTKATLGKPVQEGCITCAQIQTVIQMYELEGKRTGALEQTGHSTCLFSDVQVRTFIHMLETKYFEEIPILTAKLRENGDFSHLDKNGRAHMMSREEINQSIANKDVDSRINQFCKDIDKFNKDHASIPKEVRDAVERIRLANAIVKLQRIPPRRVQIRQEVERTLDL